MSENPKTYRVRGWKRQGIDITWDQYQDKLAEQGKRCAICLRKQGKKALAVDHNHKTGQVRGLLCGFCNSRLLKYLKDNVKLAAGLKIYITRWFEGDQK